MKPRQRSRRGMGEQTIEPLREWLRSGSLRAMGPGSRALLLCSRYVYQSRIRFHIVSQGTNLGEHSSAGTWVVRRSTIIQNRALTKEDLQMCWLKHIIYPGAQSLCLGNVKAHTVKKKIQKSIYWAEMWFGLTFESSSLQQSTLTNINGRWWQLSWKKIKTQTH